jgi:hypothetical protein
MAFPFRAKGNVLTMREIDSANSDPSLKRNFWLQTSLYN